MSPNKYMKCKYCGGNRVIKKGFRKNLTGKVQKWFCKARDTLQGESFRDLGTKSQKYH